MRRHLTLAVVVACTLTAAACSSGEPAPTQTPTVTVTETAAPEAPAGDGAVPQACRDALDVASGVIAQSNSLIQQFARAVGGDQEAIAALSDPAASQESAQQLTNDQATYTALAEECAAG